MGKKTIAGSEKLNYNHVGRVARISKSYCWNEKKRSSVPCPNLESVLQYAENKSSSIGFRFYSSMLRAGSGVSVHQLKL